MEKMHLRSSFMVDFPGASHASFVGGADVRESKSERCFFRLDVELSLLTDLTQRIFGRTKPSQPPYRYAIIADVYNYAYCMRENMGIDINILDVVGMWGPLARRNATLIKFV